MKDCDFKSLIPHATEFEKDLEQHASEKYCQIDPQIIKQLHDPWECPVEFLPWLAYSLSVDTWNDAWPEQTKRLICANSLELHKRKGTHGGLVDALAVLGITAEIVYWHEMEPKGEPGTMDVTLWLHENISSSADIILGAETLHDVHYQIEKNKRASIHYRFGLAIESDQTGFAFGSSAQLNSHQQIDADHTEINSKSESVGLVFGTSAQLNSHQQIDADHTEINSKSESVGLVFGTSAQLNSHQQIDADHTEINSKSESVGLVFGTSAQLNSHQNIDADHTEINSKSEIVGLAFGTSAQLNSHQHIDTEAPDILTESEPLLIPTTLAFTTQLLCCHRLEIAL